MSLFDQPNRQPEPHRIGDVIREYNSQESCPYPTEDDACEAFDKAASRLPFRAYKEVEAYYTQPREGTDSRKGFIDRLLIPKQEAISAGWTTGIIGVELKSSEKKIGPAICQCMDYERAIFTMQATGFKVACSWVFLFGGKSEVEGGAIASVMAQHRIGRSSIDRRGNISFRSNAGNLIHFREETWKFRNPLSGRKSGSR